MLIFSLCARFIPLDFAFTFRKGVEMRQRSPPFFPDILRHLPTGAPVNMSHNALPVIYCVHIKTAINAWLACIPLYKNRSGHSNYIDYKDKAIM